MVDRVVWRRSTRCEMQNCVEVGTVPGEVLVRDGKDVDGGVLAFPPARWRSFLDGVKGGSFDR